MRSSTQLLRCMSLDVARLTQPSDSLGQHVMQLSLGRCGTFCHFVTNSLWTSRLPSPTARPSIVHNFSRRLPALVRIPLPPSVYWRAETPFPTLVALGPSLFYRS